MHPQLDILPKSLVLTAVFCNMLTHGFIRFLHNLVQNASVQKIGILCHFEEQIFLVKLVQAV